MKFNKHGNGNSLKGKNEPAIILKTGRFDSIDSAVIISSISKVCSVLYCLTLLMMTAESMLSKCQVIRITMVLCSSTHNPVLIEQEIRQNMRIKSFKQHKRRKKLAPSPDFLIVEDLVGISAAYFTAKK